MSNSLRLVSPLGLLLLCVGCSGPVGTWKLHDVTPPNATDDFPVRSIKFIDSHAYTLAVQHGDAVEESHGTYVYDADAQRLTLTDTGGKVHQYGAKICGSCGYIDLWNADGVERWRARLLRR